MFARDNLAIEADIHSDTAAVSPLVEVLRRPRRRRVGCVTRPAAASASSATNWPRPAVWGALEEDRLPVTRW